MKFQIVNNQKIENYEIRNISELDLSDIQKLCNNCEDYYIMDEGKSASHDAGKMILEMLPPEKTYEEKYVYGVFKNNINLVGLVDIVKDYPEKDVWMLGLLLVDPSERKKGLGKLIHAEIVKLVKSESGKKIRIGVLENNKNALEFWMLLGYEFIKESRMSKTDERNKTILVFEYII